MARQHILLAVEEKSGKKVQEELQRMMVDDAAFLARLKHIYTAKGCMLVQGTPGVLATEAAYIDLNAVRAEFVTEPKEWRWCGYAEAAAAQSSAREGIYSLLRFQRDDGSF